MDVAKLIKQISDLEEKIKTLLIKDEESTQLIIKLDTKLYNAREEISSYDKKIKEIDVCLENANKLHDKLKQENEILRLENEILKTKN